MSWECSQHLFDILTSPKISIDEVQFFILKRGFLILPSYTDEPEMLDVTQKIQTLYEDVVFVLSPLHLTEYFDLHAPEVHNKILLIKREIRIKYSFPKISKPLSAKFVQYAIRIVLANIGGLQKIRDPYSPLYVPETVLEHLKDVSKELQLLLNFAYFVSERSIEPQSQHHVNFSTHVCSVSIHSSMLIWLNLPDLAPEQINVMLSDLLQMRIQPIQPCIRKIYVDVLQSLKLTIQSAWYPNIRNEDTIDSQGIFLETILHKLVEVPTNSNSSQRVALKDHLEILQNMLILLRANIFRVPIKDLEFLLRDIEMRLLMLDFWYTHYMKMRKRRKTWHQEEVKLTQVLDLSGNIHNLSILIYLTIRKAFQSNLPRIHGLGHVDYLLNNLEKLQTRSSDSLDSVMDKLQLVQKEFESLQPFLQALSAARHSDLNEIQHCATQLISKAHEVEYIVDAWISEKAPTWCLECWILQITEEITLIRAEVARLHEKKMDWHALNTVTAQTSNLARSPMMNEEIVGFEDANRKVKRPTNKRHQRARCCLNYRYARSRQDDFGLQTLL